MTVSSESSTSSVSISPSVLFSIGEIYQRRSDSTGVRAVGALMGSTTVSTDGKVQVTVSHSFVVPHSEVGDQISINSDYYKQRSDLHRKCYGKASALVGWFSMRKEAEEVSEKNTSFINESFSREVAAIGASPVSVHLELIITKEGLIKRNVSITETSNKTIQTPHTTTIAFSSNDAFACQVVLESVESKPEASVHEIPDELAFVTSQIEKLKKELAHIESLQQKIKSGEFKAEAGVQEAIEAVLKSKPFPKSNERLQQEIDALNQVCQSIRDQLNVLYKLLTYQA